MAKATASSTDANQAKSLAISFINSNKGKPLLLADEYVLKLNKNTTTTKYWICTLNGCSAKLHTDLNSQFIKIVGDHNHFPEKKKQLAVREFREKAKQRAIHETTPIPCIYDEECAKAMLSNATIAVLPSERKISSGINKVRRSITPTIPTTQLFEIPDLYSKTLNKNNSLVVDKMITKRQRILLFSSSEQLKMLFGAETILMDGTFSTCPNMFDQVYTIHAIQYDQSIYRAIQRIGLSTIYNDDDDIKQCYRKFMALPLLLEAIIEDTYDELLAAMPTQLKDTLHNLLEYFQEQWFLKVPISQWCVHGLSMKTNNNAEGKIFILFELKFNFLFFCAAFHSRFNRRVQVNHPNIWSFIKFLQGEENRFHHIYIQFTAGLGARTKQAKTIAIQRRIDTLDKRYYDGAMNAMEYLDGLSFTVAKRKK